MHNFFRTFVYLSVGQGLKGEPFPKQGVYNDMITSVRCKKPHVNFSPLFILFMAFKFLCSLVIVFLCGFYLSFSFYEHMPRQLACRATFCANSFLHFALCFRGFLANDTHPWPYPCHLFRFWSFCFPVGFYGVILSTSQVFGMGSIWLTSWVHPPRWLMVPPWWH